MGKNWDWSGKQIVGTKPVMKMYWVQLCRWRTTSVRTGKHGRQPWGVRGDAVNSQLPREQWWSGRKSRSGTDIMRTRKGDSGTDCKGGLVWEIQERVTETETGPRAIKYSNEEILETWGRRDWSYRETAGAMPGTELKIHRFHHSSSVSKYV